jgi:hypothetical protein
MKVEIRTKNRENRSSENGQHFKYLGMKITDQNLIQGEIKRRQNSDNACYHSVHNLSNLVCCLRMKKFENARL